MDNTILTAFRCPWTLPTIDPSSTSSTTSSTLSSITDKFATSMISFPNSIDDEYNDYGMCTTVDLTLIVNAFKESLKLKQQHDDDEQQQQPAQQQQQQQQHDSLNWSNLHLLFQYSKSFNDIVVTENNAQVLLQDATLESSSSPSSSSTVTATMSSTSSASSSSSSNSLQQSLTKTTKETKESPSSSFHQPTDSSSKIRSSNNNSIDKKNSGSNTSNNRHRVTFTTIQIREYALTVGEHPFCSDALPLTLDWSYSTEGVMTFNLQDYESTYYHSKPQRLSYMERKNRLRRVMNYTEGQLRNEQHKIFLQLQSDLVASSRTSVEDPFDDDEDYDEDDRDDIDGYVYDMNGYVADNEKISPSFHNIQLSYEEDAEERDARSSSNELNRLHRSTSASTNLMALSHGYDKFGLSQ